MGLFHRLGPWAVLLLIQSPSAAALANAQAKAVVRGVGGGQAALVAQGGGRGEQEIPAEVRGWVEGAEAAYSKGDAAEALRLQLKALEWVNAQPKLLDPFRAQVLNELGFLFRTLGRRQEALATVEDAVKITRELAKINPAFFPDLATALNNLGIHYSELGREQEALAPTEEAVNTTRKLTRTNPAFLRILAGSLNNLGNRYSKLGLHHEALTPTEESVTIYRELAKSNAAYLDDLVASMNNLGASYNALGRHKEALGTAEEAVKITRELAKTNPAFLGNLARSMNNLGASYNALGRHKEALGTAEEALKITRELAKTNPAFLGNLARSLNYLGTSYNALGRPQEALDPTEEALQIHRELVKTNISYLNDLAGTLNNLSNHYSELGRPQEALALSEEALKIRRELVKTNSAFLGDLAISLNNLGISYSELGRRQDALAPIEEAVKIHRELAKTNLAYLDELAMGLNNLGNRYSELGRPQEALALSEEALKIRRELVKTNSAFLGDLAVSLINLGNRYSELGQRSEALQHNKEAEKITRELAKTNPAYLNELAGSLNNLGNLYSELGRSQEALVHTEEGVKIYSELAKTNPAFLPDLAMALNNLGGRYSQLGNPNAALPLLQEAVSSEVTYLQAQLPLVPEARRQALVGTFGDRWQVPFSFAQQGEAGAALALYTRLNRQGLLQDIRRNQVLLARSGPQRPLFEQLTAISSQLARPNLPLEEEKALLARKEQLEQELYRLLPQVKPRLVVPEQVALRLPADGVLVEFQRYRSINVGSGLYGPPRYLALVLTPKGAMHAVPLGEAAELEPLIQKALGRVAGIPDRSGVSSEQAQQALAEVRRRLFDPLLPQVGAAKRWIISPDGEIHRVPLAALPASDGDLNGATLGETRQLRVITTGRDLLDEAPAPASPSAALVMADPDYDARLGPSSPGATPPSTLLQTRSGDDLAKRWGPLPEFKEEGEEVAALLGSSLISGVQATTTRLQRAQGPRIVHIATHGFFLPDRKEDLDAKGPFQGFTTLEMTLLAREDPQLRSGIVLAGANHPDTNPNDDGRLTALEATALNLSGTALVTLSACSTGLGSQATGEGVYGLQRALRVAGARSTLLSLWKVDDLATRTFMKRFYTLLQQGVGRAEALREVQRQFRDAPIKNGLRLGWSHPHYWAAWQLSGDSGALPPLGPKPNQAQP